MKKILAINGLVVAYIVMLIKLTYLTIEAFNENIIVFIVFNVFNLFFIFGFIKAFIKVLNFKEETTIKENEIIPFIVILSGALIVYMLGTYLDLDKNITVGVVSLGFGLFLSKYGPEATLGAFIGTGIFITTSFYGVIIVSVVAGFVNILLKDLFKGFGGKLGTMAFISGLTTFLILRETLGSGSIKDLSNIIIIFIVAIISATLTFIINNELKRGSVVAYGLVILLGSLFLLFEKTKSLDLSSVVYGAALIGMSRKSKTINYYVIVSASIIYGLFYLVGISFTNIGGKAGLLSLISILIAKEIYVTINKLIKKDNLEAELI